MLIKTALRLKNGAYILEKLLKKDKAWLFLNDNLEVPNEFFTIYKKIENGYPIEYIFSEVYFYKEKFFIKKGVLIPRDDTEVIVSKAIEVIKKFKIKSLVDCCSGSGVIAIILKKYFPHLKVTATDISKKAIETIKINSKLHNVELEIKKCNLFNKKAQLLVANPPYVETSHKKPNLYEPNIAFFAGKDGLDIIKKIIIKAKKLNYKIAIIEIGYNQKNNLEKFLKNKVRKYRFFKDLGNRIRGVEIFY